MRNIFQSNELSEDSVCAKIAHTAADGKVYKTQVLEGALYYGEIRRRTVVPFSDRLRTLVTDFAEEMHRLFDEALTPPPVYKPHCHACSLYDLCLPKQMSSLKTADQYLKTELL